MTEEVVRTMATKEIMTKLHEHQVPAGEVSHPRHNVIKNPQVVYNELILEYDHPHTPTGRVRQTRPAAQFVGQPFVLQHRAPLLGEHTKEVLEMIGVGAKEAEGLRSSGVVRWED